MSATCGDRIVYEQFYGLKEKPFQVVPSLDYLYLSDKHQYALNYLQCGLTENMGIIMLTGEFGTGKTTLIRHLLKKLDSKTETAYIFNSSGSPDQLLSRILNEFELFPKKGRAATLEVITQFVKDKCTEHKQVLIVIDEAQNLTAETLEMVRMLSNLQTDGQVMLQIMFVAESEFIDKIKILQELSRRIAVHYHLSGLDRKDTGKYISFCLQMAGGRPNLFASDAVDTIHRITRGIPRSINRLCQAALVYGYTIETPKIDNMIIEQVAGDKIGFDINFQFEDSSALAAAESKTDDEILQRIGVLEGKISALQGYILSRLQLKDQRSASFKDDITSRLLQIIVDERRSSDELLRRLSQPNLKVENQKQSKTVIQSIKGHKQEESATPDYIPFQRKKTRQISD